MRKKIVAGNWKLNLSYAEAMSLSDAIADGLGDGDCEVVLAPSYLYLHEVLRRVGHCDRMAIAAQNCASFDRGAYTGEVSTSMLASVGIEYVIIGHSERRKIFHESDSEIATKVRIALLSDLIPIFCCGESLEEREAGHQFQVVASQLERGLKGLDASSVNSCVIAYEPVWAIGTGKVATNEQAQEMHAHIRHWIIKNYGDSAASSISILYGGSVNSSNASGLFECPDVDGALVGGASLKAEEFLSIIKMCK